MACGVIASWSFEEQFYSASAGTSVARSDAVAQEVCSQTVGDYRKRTHKLFESANIKIDSVVSDLFGVTGRNLMDLLVTDRKALTLSDVAGCVRGQLRGKEAELFRSIQGFFTDHHRFILKMLLSTIATLEAQIEALDHEIGCAMKGNEPLLERMKKAPGISDVSAFDILAEIGPNLDSFPTDRAHWHRWSGLCPGNNESAGKRKSGRSPVKKHHPGFSNDVMNNNV